jgi:uncharacterized protein
MHIDFQLSLIFCLFLGAVLYSSVGHGGASAYIATMALFGIAPAAMRPTALVLNIVVSLIAFLRYSKAGMFSWRIVWPLLIGSIPMAFIGGSIQLEGKYYKPLLGCVLIYAALRLIWPAHIKSDLKQRDIPIFIGILCGVIIGFLSGLTGTGGGIFLSPLILFMGWSDIRNASGVAALFILCNSIAGIMGNFIIVQALPPNLPLLAFAVFVGSMVGTLLGVKVFTNPAIFKALGIVLFVAGIKLIGVF